MVFFLIYEVLNLACRALEVQCEVRMDPREQSLTGKPGKSLQDLSPGVRLNQIFEADWWRDGTGGVKPGSLDKSFSHRVRRRTTKELQQPAAAVWHREGDGGGPPGGTMGLRPAEAGPEGHHRRCEAAQPAV